MLIMFDFQIIINVTYSHEDMQIKMTTIPEGVGTPEELNKAISILLSSIKLK